MTTIEFSTSPPKYQPKIVAHVTFPVLAYLNTPTVDRRTILGPRRANISMRLPANIMTDYSKGPIRPGASQLGHYRQIGALLHVTIDNNVMSGHGVLYKPLPDDVDFWPGVDLGDVLCKVYKNGRADMRQWRLIGVTLRNYGPVWGDLPRVIIERNT